MPPLNTCSVQDFSTVPRLGDLIRAFGLARFPFELAGSSRSSRSLKAPLLPLTERAHKFVKSRLRALESGTHFHVIRFQLGKSAACSDGSCEAPGSSRVLPLC